MGRKNMYLSPDEWLRHWERIYNKYGEVMIEIVGGEPFIYRNFIELVKKLSEIHSIRITTNISGDIGYFAKEVKPDKVSFNLSYHMSFIGLDTVMDKALILKNAGFRSNICFLAYPPQITQIDRLTKIFKDANIDFSLIAFWGEYEGRKYPEAYTDEERKMISPHLKDDDKVSYHLNAKSPRGRLCNAGHKYASIQGDGNVVRCGSSADKSIGNILDDDFRLLDGPMLCESDTCPCNEHVCLL